MGLAGGGIMAWLLLAMATLASAKEETKIVTRKARRELGPLTYFGPGIDGCPIFEQFFFYWKVLVHDEES